MLLGSHGETMFRLLHPGFHSGTISKLYQRLRRAERHDQPETIRKITALLDHVRESLEHFVERELLALLRQSNGWGGLAIELANIGLASNRVRVELRCPTLSGQPLVFSFDHQGGFLLAGVLEPGWLTQLSAEQRLTLAAALAGLYKLAGVQLTREQIAASLPATIFAFDITDDGLAVWTTADGTRDVVYDLNAGPELTPQPRSDVMPMLATDRLLFSKMPLTWHEWVRMWQSDHERGERPPLPMAVLPPAKNA